jgi:hypothetical protein
MRKLLLRKTERQLLERASDEWAPMPKHGGLQRLFALRFIEERSFKDKEIVAGFLWRLRYEWRLTDAGRRELGRPSPPPGGTT